MTAPSPSLPWWEDRSITDTLPPRDKDNWILLRSCRPWWPLNPRPGEVTIQDVASGVSKEARWAGQTRFFFSVAQHSVLASLLVAPRLALRALLHDAAEGLGFRDLPSRFKRRPEMAFYKAAEKRAQAVVYVSFDLAPEEPPEIKQADMALLAYERAELHPATPDLADLGVPDLSASRLAADALPWPLGLSILPAWGPDEAEHRYLARYHEILAYDVRQL